MQIDSVRVLRFDLERIDAQWRTSTYADSAIAGFILEATVDGVVGLGATAAHPLQISAGALDEELRTIVAPALVGADPLRGSAIVAGLRDRGVHRRSLLAADLALHDLLGRIAGLPCYALWGGTVKPAIKVIRMIGLKTPEQLVQTAHDLVASGYTHLKVKIGGVLQDDIRRLAMLRERLGPRIWLGVDGNGAYDREGAIRLARELVAYDVRMLEQPVPYRDIAALRDLTAASSIPVMADQCVVDVASALEVCRRQAAHIVSIKVSKMGTIDECRRIAEICAAFGVGVHVGGSAAPGVVDLAQAHLAISSPAIGAEAEVGEFEAVTGDPLRGATVANGEMVISNEPGFGVTLANVA